MLRLGIDPEKPYRAIFICQDGLCCCNMALISFRLFRKNLGNLRDFFGQMVYRPPWQKISRTPMVITLLFFAMFLGISSAIFFAKCVKFSAIFSSTTYTKTAELAQLRHRASRLLCLFLQLPCSTDVILSDIA